MIESGVQLVAWWEEYGLNDDFFRLNKPLQEEERGLLVQTVSYKLLDQYFPLELKPFKGVILLYGSYGSGKSTMLKYLESYWKHDTEVKKHYVEANIDANTYERFERYLLQTILEGITENRISDNISVPEITRLIRTSNIKGHHLFLVDEIHKVDEAFVLKFLSDHQSTIEGLKELPVTVFFAGQEILANQKEGKGGITGVFDLEIPLLPLTRQEAIDIVDRRLRAVSKPGNQFRNPFTDTAMDLVVDISKGAPRTVLKLCKSVLIVNASAPKPIIIDPLLVSKAAVQLSGEDFVRIRKIVFSPAYANVRKKLERLFVESETGEKSHDYLSVINAIYTRSKPANSNDLENEIKISGNLERILGELHRERVITSTISSQRDRLGTMQVTYYSLDPQVKSLCDSLNDKFKVVPAAYLDRVFAPIVRSEEDTTNPDYLLRLFNESVVEIVNSEAVSQIQRAHQLYLELKSQELSEYTVVSHYYSILQLLFGAFNIFSRNSAGLNSKERIKNTERSLSHVASAEKVSEFHLNVESVLRANDIISKDFSKAENIDIQGTIKGAESVLGEILKLFTSLGKSNQKVYRDTKIKDKTPESFEDIRLEFRNLRAELEQIKLNISPRGGSQNSDRQSYLTQVIESNQHLTSNQCPNLIDAFIFELKKADDVVSKELSNDKSFISDTVDSIIIKRILSKNTDRTDLPDRIAMLQLLTGAFEEFCRYVILEMPEGIIKSKTLAKESSLGRMLGPLLGEKFNSRIMKYNPGGIGELDPETDSSVETNLEIMLDIKDPKLAEIGEGPTQLVLMTFVRNYCKHTMREKLVNGERFFRIFDNLVAGFLWFFEYCIEKNLLMLQSIALYYGGDPPRLMCNNPNYTVFEMHSGDIRIGAFYIGNLILENKEKKYLLVNPNSTSRDPIYDIANIPAEVNKERLPEYHIICSDVAGVPLTDIDQNLFLIKITWYQPKEQNSARHKGDIAFFDKRTLTGKFAESHDEVDGFYALAYQSGLGGDRFSILTPVRFFTCIEEVVSFIGSMSIPFDDLPPTDQHQLAMLLGLDV